jgi:hypothetical protein
MRKDELSASAWSPLSLRKDELEGFIEEINHLRREREVSEEECSERRREETG